MVKFGFDISLILVVCIFQIHLITANPPHVSKFVRKNNNDLHKCLSSSLSSSTRTIYPCNTSINQNSSKYRCIHFDVTTLASMRGSQIPHSPAVVVYVKDSKDVQNVVKCATKLDYMLSMH
jgi:hypothetical protein